MIIWINGTFGVGKTTTSTGLVERVPTLRLFDPEWVGYMLQSNLRDLAFDDFQELAAWRALVPVVAHQIIGLTGQDLVAVQTVLVEDYWRELRAGIDAHGHALFHVVLDADPESIRQRATDDQVDPGALQWRLDHVPTYLGARSWLLDAADLVIDTTSLGPDTVVDAIIAATPTRR